MNKNLLDEYFFFKNTKKLFYIYAGKLEGDTSLILGCVKEKGAL